MYSKTESHIKIKIHFQKILNSKFDLNRRHLFIIIIIWIYSQTETGLMVVWLQQKVEVKMVLLVDQRLHSKLQLTEDYSKHKLKSMK